MSVNKIEIDVTNPGVDSAESSPNRPPGSPRGGGAPQDPDAPKWLNSLRDILERVTKGTLTYAEAQQRADKIAQRYSDSILDYGRDNNLIGLDQNARDFARQGVYGAATAAGQDVQSPMDERLNDAITREVTKYQAEQERIEKEAANRDEQRKNEADNLQKRMKEAIERDKIERARADREASIRDKQRQSEADDLHKRMQAAVARAAEEKKRIEAEEARVQKKAAAALAPPDDGSASMARARTIAGGVQSIASGGSGGVMSGLGQIATTGAFGPQAAAFMASPMGVALMAAPIVMGQLNRAMDGLTRRTVAAGQALAGDSHFSFTAGLEATSDALEHIPIAGQAVALQIKAMTLPLKVMEETTKAFIQRGEQIRGYSAALSTAYAYRDVQRLQGDIKEAQALGGGVGSLVRSQSDLDKLQHEATLELRTAVADGLAEVVGSLRDIIVPLKPFLQAALRPIAIMIRIETFIFSGPLRNIGRILKGVEDWLERNGIIQAEAKPNDMIQQVLDLAKQPLAPGAPVQVDPAQRAQNGRLQMIRRP